MFKYKLLIIVLMLAAGQALWAQSNKKETEAQPNSLTPYYPEKTKETPKNSRKVRARKVTYDARDRFYDRMEQVAKEQRKTEKELQKPQYADPSYFGHKRPPKRRPSGKMKYCKECGIRH
jgi:hypothetical protein